MPDSGDEVCASEVEYFPFCAPCGDKTPDEIKRMCAEVQRINNKQEPPTFAEEFFQGTVKEFLWAAENLDRTSHHTAFVFAVTREHLYGSPDRAVQMWLEALPSPGQPS